MVEKKFVDFIGKIIQQTKENMLEWKYLDTNKPLYEGMGWANKKINYNFFSSNTETISPNFDVEDSFFTRIDEMSVVLFVQHGELAKLYVVPNTYRKVVILTPDEYGEYITQLFNVVQSKFPNAESFIDNFLDKNRNEGEVAS